MFAVTGVHQLLIPRGVVLGASVKKHTEFQKNVLSGGIKEKNQKCSRFP